MWTKWNPASLACFGSSLGVLLSDCLSLEQQRSSALAAGTAVVQRFLFGAKIFADTFRSSHPDGRLARAGLVL